MCIRDRHRVVEQHLESQGGVLYKFHINAGNNFCRLKFHGGQGAEDDSQHQSHQKAYQGNFQCHKKAWHIIFRDGLPQSGPPFSIKKTFYHNTLPLQ